MEKTYYRVIVKGNWEILSQCQDLFESKEQAIKYCEDYGYKIFGITKVIIELI